MPPFLGLSIASLRVCGIRRQIQPCCGQLRIAGSRANARSESCGESGPRSSDGSRGWAQSDPAVLGGPDAESLRDAWCAARAPIRSAASHAPTMGPISITHITTVVVPVVDQEQALAFYVERLGLEKVLDVTYASVNAPTNAATSSPNRSTICANEASVSSTVSCRMPAVTTTSRCPLLCSRAPTSSGCKTNGASSDSRR